MRLGWAINFKQRLRFTPLHWALVLADSLAGWLPKRWPRQSRPVLAPGVSVLIPERGTPDLLAECLLAATQALAQIDEINELIVVVNGAPESDYSALRSAYPAVRWQFHSAGLGYNGAIRAGLAAVKHDWVYLLNSDMRIEADALVQLLPYRAAHIFALTSQIFFVDSQRRREETGWSDCRIVGGRVEMYERTPENSRLARGNLYPGGGSSLCQTRLLRRYAQSTQVYSPFYYEDADWGARAWAEGFEVLFCPNSRAHHHHRGTVSRYFEPAEVERVIERNALLFELRHGWTELTPPRAMSTVCANGYRTQVELSAPALALGVFTERLRSQRARQRGFDFSRAAVDHFYPKPSGARADKPCVLLVTPFALFPPAHGGARRVAELSQRLAKDVDLILLSDERSLYGANSEAFFDAFRSVHLVEGRGDQAGEGALPWPARLQRHAHAALRAELDRLIAVYDPDIVQVEFMELASLRARSPGRARFVLALHDVYLDGGAFDAVQRRAMADYAAITVCSADDAALLDDPRAHLIANGATSRLANYQPSADAPEQASKAPNILFMGPFRYTQNYTGILQFIRLCWPAIRARFPDASLTILGGPESGPMRFGEPLLRARGVELVDRFVDPTAYLARASLSINPQMAIRGSALKVIESILAGRVCVSTRDGARGFADGDLPGLCVVENVAEMGAAIIDLLAHPDQRHKLEKVEPGAVARWTWDGIAEQQLHLYQSLANSARRA